MTAEQGPRQYSVIRRSEECSSIHRTSDMAWCALDRGYETAEGQRVVLGSILLMHHDDAMRFADALEDGTQAMRVVWLSGPEDEALLEIPAGNGEFGRHVD